MTWLVQPLLCPNLAGQTVAVVVRLHASATGPVCLWDEEHPAQVFDDNGLAYVILGAVRPLDVGLFRDGPRWLSVVHNGEDVPPQTRVPVDGRALVMAHQLTRLRERLDQPTPALQRVEDAVATLRDHLDAVHRERHPQSDPLVPLQVDLDALQMAVHVLQQAHHTTADAVHDLVGSGGELEDHERRIRRLEARAAPVQLAPDAGMKHSGALARMAPPTASLEPSMSDSLPPAPWFDEVREAFLDGSASVFVLHGLVDDLHPVPVSGGLTWGPLADAVAARLTGSRDIVLRYDLFKGIRGEGATAQRSLEGQPVLPGVQPAFARIGKLLGDRRKSTGVVIDQADLLFPPGAARALSPDDRLARSALRHWLDDPKLRESNNILFLVTSSADDLPAELLRSARCRVILVNAHGAATLRAYLRTVYAVDVPVPDDVTLNGPLLAHIGALNRLGRAPDAVELAQWTAVFQPPAPLSE